MDQELSDSSVAEVYRVKDETLIIQVIDSSDLKCVKEEIDTPKPVYKNVRWWPESRYH